MARIDENDILKIIHRRGRATPHQIRKGLGFGWFSLVRRKRVAGELRRMVAAGTLSKDYRRIQKNGHPACVDLYTLTQAGREQLRVLLSGERLDAFERAQAAAHPEAA